MRRRQVLVPVGSDEFFERGACRERDPELWFMDDKRDVEYAKSICRTCPVVNDCLTWALNNPRGATHGVWGGTDRDERDRMTRGRR